MKLLNIYMLFKINKGVRNSELFEKALRSQSVIDIDYATSYFKLFQSLLLV